MRGVTHFRPGLYSDATHGTAVNSAGDNVNMTTFSTADAGGHGVALCIAYLGDKSTLTAKLALQALTVAMEKLPEMQGRKFRPRRCVADDDAAFHRAVREVWPYCQPVICLWHILQRNMTQKLTGLVGGAVAKNIELKIWRAAKQATLPSGQAYIAHTLIPSIYDILRSPCIPVELRSLYVPRNVSANIVQRAEKAGLPVSKKPVTECDVDAAIAAATPASGTSVDESMPSPTASIGGTVSGFPDFVTEAMRCEAWLYIVDRLFLNFARVQAIFPPFGKYDRSDMCLWNNIMESFHNWFKHNFKDDSGLVRVPKLPHALRIASCALREQEHYAGLRAEEDKVHRRRMGLRPDLASVLTAYNTFAAVSKTLQLSRRHHDLYWEHYSSIDVVTGNLVNRRVVLKKPVAGGFEYKVCRSPAVASHADVFVTTDAATGMRCSCSLFNNRELCPHICTVLQFEVGTMGFDEYETESKAGAMVALLGKAPIRGALTGQYEADIDYAENVCELFDDDTVCPATLAVTVTLDLDVTSVASSATAAAVPTASLRTVGAARQQARDDAEAAITAAKSVQAKLKRQDKKRRKSSASGRGQGAQKSNRQRVVAPTTGLGTSAV